MLDVRLDTLNDKILDYFDTNYLEEKEQKQFVKLVKRHISNLQLDNELPALEEFSDIGLTPQEKDSLYESSLNFVAEETSKRKRFIPNTEELFNDAKAFIARYNKRMGIEESVVLDKETSIESNVSNENVNVAQLIQFWKGVSRREVFELNKNAEHYHRKMAEKEATEFWKKLSSAQKFALTGDRFAREIADSLVKNNVTKEARKEFFADLLNPQELGQKFGFN